MVDHPEWFVSAHLTNLNREKAKAHLTIPLEGNKIRPSHKAPPSNGPQLSLPLRS